MSIRIVSVRGGVIVYLLYFAMTAGCSNEGNPALGPVTGRAGNDYAPSQTYGMGERDAFRAVAERFEAPFLILDFHAPLPVLRARIAERLARADDASEADLAVLERQLAAREPLTPAEMAVAFAVDATRPVSHDLWRPVIERLRRSAAGTASRPPARADRPDDETIT